MMTTMMEASEACDRAFHEISSLDGLATLFLVLVCVSSMRTNREMQPCSSSQTMPFPVCTSETVVSATRATPSIPHPPSAIPSMARPPHSQARSDCVHALHAAAAFVFFFRALCPVCAGRREKQWQVLVLYGVMCEEGDRRDGDSDSGVASCGVVVW